MGTHSSVLACRIPMYRGAWWATVHGVTKSWTQLRYKRLKIWNKTRVLSYQSYSTWHWKVLAKANKQGKERKTSELERKA